MTISGFARERFTNYLPFLTVDDQGSRGWSPRRFFHAFPSLFTRGSTDERRITKQSQLAYKPRQINNLTYSLWAKKGAAPLARPT